MATRRDIKKTAMKKSSKVSLPKNYNVADIVRDVHKALAENTIGKKPADRKGSKIAVKQPNVSEVSIPTVLTRLNKTGKDVHTLQNSLAFLGFEILEDEFNEARFGISTIKAVKEFQRSTGITVSGKFDSGTRKVLRANLLDKNPKLIATLHTHTIRGRAMTNDGFPLKDSLVTISYFKNRKVYSESRKTDTTGFFNVPFCAPRDASGKCMTSFSVTVIVFIPHSREEIYRKNITVNKHTTYCNFGKYYGPSEYERAEQAIRKAAPEVDEIKNLFVPVLSVEATALAKLTGLGSDVIGAFASAYKLKASLDETGIEYDAFTERILYGLIRNGVPHDPSSIIGTETLRVAQLMSKYGSGSNFFNTLTRQAVLNSRRLLSDLMMVDSVIVQNTLSQAIDENVIDHSLKTELPQLLDVFERIRVQYVLDHLKINQSVTLRDILLYANVNDSYHEKVAACYVRTGGISKEFEFLIKKVLPEKQRKSLLRLLDICWIVNYSKEGINCVLDSLGDRYIGNIVTIPDSKWKEYEVAEADSVHERIASFFPDLWYLFKIDEEMSSGSERIKSQLDKRSDVILDTKDFILKDMPEGVRVLYMACLLDDERKRFIFTESAMTDEYSFSESTEQNAKIRNIARVLQRLYHISSTPDIAVSLLGAGVTSAVSAFYKGQDNLGLSQNDISRVWRSIELLYYKTVTLYNDILMSSREDMKSMSTTSAELRNLFGSIDAYGYEDELDLLSTPAYLTDLLRFLTRIKADGGRTAFDLLVSRRPDIIKIKLNLENSNILVPQIDNVCEVLEDKVSPINWSDYQTSGDSVQLCAEPQFTNLKAYEKISTSPYPLFSPFFSLPVLQNRILLKELGIERYKLMELFCMDKKDIATEYFGMSPLEASVFDNSFSSAYREIEFKKEPEGVYITSLLGTLPVFGLDYSEMLDVLHCLGINVTDADPYNNGYPDTKNQYIELHNTTDELQRLQRFIILLKKTGMAPSELYKYIDDPAVGNGSIDTTLIIALYKLFDKIHAQDEDTNENDIYEDISNAQLSILRDHSLNSLASIPARDEMPSTLAVNYNIDKSLLSSLYQSWELEKCSDETAATNMLMASVLLSSLDATLDEVIHVSRVLGLPSEWSEDNLKDALTIIYFNHKYLLDGVTPIVADTELTALDCKRAMEIIKYLRILNLEKEADLAYYAKVDGFEQEQKKTDYLKDVLRKKKNGNLYAVRESMKEIRIAKRDILTAYLLSTSYNGKTSDDLFNELLLDVEMGPDQDTTRITMATNAVQIFVQRCLLGLEEGIAVTASQLTDTTSENNWSQWTWLKNYRVWEAARKIFFFPENWIEPELRDDKTPQFKEFIDELDQNDNTEENIETAVTNYLYALDEIASLEVCSVHRQNENEVDIIHVIARTKGSAPVFYYRNYNNKTDVWGAWEKMEIEIEGDQIVPVIYNKRLYVFWLKFYEKALKPVKMPKDTSEDAGEPAKYYEIQLAWTFRKNGRWASPSLSKKKLLHPWERPRYSYDMKPYIDKSNRLHLDIYLSTSREFNGRLNNSNDKTTFNLYPEFFSRYSHVPYSETSEPWHSSSFIFEGDVTEVNIKSLDVRNTTSLSDLDRLFENESGHIGLLQIGDSGPRLKLPEGMRMKNGRLENASDNSKLNTIEVVASLLDNDVVNDLMSKAIDDMNLDRSDKSYRDTVNFYIRNFRKGIAEKALWSRELLANAKAPFSLVISQQTIQMNSMIDGAMMFYQDKNRSLCFKTENVTKINMEGLKVHYSNQEVILPKLTLRKCDYKASIFYHPYVKSFIKEINKSGLIGLYERVLQTEPWKHDVISRNSGEFLNAYSPSSAITNTPEEIIEFAFGEAYSVYNWELFFHIPLTVACRLSERGQYEEAMKWFHYIFNPMDYSKTIGAPECYWITKPFFENAVSGKNDVTSDQRIETILKNIGNNTAELAAWKNNPFNPHIIARYRTVTYQKAVVYKYIENLLNWGDAKFREDNMESINEATLLYVLASEILGERPKKVKAPEPLRYDMDFKTMMSSGIDSFGNHTSSGHKRIDLLLKTENLVRPDKDYSVTGSPGCDVPALDIFYYDVPCNSNIEGYWNILEDRLGKIRSSLNIDGVFRKVSITSPEIDPGDLVNAAAGGGTLADAISSVTSSAVYRPYYRFRSTIMMAEKVCSEVKTLGDKLLSVLEKKDAEDMALLRSNQEKMLLNAVSDIRKKEISEIQSNIASLEHSLARAEKSRDYYESLETVSAKEEKAISLSQSSIDKARGAIPLSAIGAGLMAGGNIITGASGVASSPVCEYAVCFEAIGHAITIEANVMQMNAGIEDRKAGITATNASYERRAGEWALQAQLSQKDIDSLTSQIESASARLEIAEKNMENHTLQIEQADAMLDLIKSKYTNQALYNWMKTEVIKVYKNSYNLALHYAKAAEECYLAEIGEKPDVIGNCWNIDHDGLLSGDSLLCRIHELEKKYQENNKRDYELTKHISLSSIASATEYGSALLDLIYKGECEVEIPEWLYDMDYKDHIFRKIKSVSLSIPCLVGPHTNVNCILTMTGSSIRKSSNGKPLAFESVASESIATSTAINDSGLFEVNFNDERYLPFEGYGAISKWHISLPSETNHFDRNSISDVIINICYTARKETISKVSHGPYLRNAVRVLSFKHDLPSVWRKIQNGETVFEVQLEDTLYPYWMRESGKTIKASFGESFKRSGNVLSEISGISLDVSGKLKIDLSNVDFIKKLTDIKLVIDISL